MPQDTELEAVIGDLVSRGESQAVIDQVVAQWDAVTGKPAAPANVRVEPPPARNMAERFAQQYPDVQAMGSPILAAPGAAAIGVISRVAQGAAPVAQAAAPGLMRGAAQKAIGFLESPPPVLGALLGGYQGYQFGKPAGPLAGVAGALTGAMLGAGGISRLGRGGRGARSAPAPGPRVPPRPAPNTTPTGSVVDEALAAELAARESTGGGFSRTVSRPPSPPRPSTTGSATTPPPGPTSPTGGGFTASYRTQPPKPPGPTPDVTGTGSASAPPRGPTNPTGTGFSGSYNVPPKPKAAPTTPMEAQVLRREPDFLLDDITARTPPVKGNKQYGQPVVESYPELGRQMRAAEQAGDAALVQRFTTARSQIEKIDLGTRLRARRAELLKDPMANQGAIDLINEALKVTRASSR